MENSVGCRSAGSLGEHGDHVVAFGWRDPLSGVLFTVDLIFHKEMALLFQVCATVGTHVTLRVAVMVPQLHKHTTAGGREESSSISDEHTKVAPGPGASPQRPIKGQMGASQWAFSDKLDLSFLESRDMTLETAEVSPSSTEQPCFFWFHMFIS